jgi:D-glycero-D-manno-heptose 1,7-bisphosphate phosphatase
VTAPADDAVRREPLIRHLILDRDGVLNRERAEGVFDVAAWQWERGALAGLEALAEHGLRVSVATNQSAIGRGLVAAEDVEAVHEWLAGELRSLGIDLVGIFSCPHAPDHGCRCRKPRPGLVEQAVAASAIETTATALVGDARRDLEAGAAAGVRTILVATGKGATADPTTRALADATCDDLAAVAELVVGDQRSLR